MTPYARRQKDRRRRERQRYELLNEHLAHLPTWIRQVGYWLLELGRRAQKLSAAFDGLSVGSGYHVPKHLFRDVPLAIDILRNRHDATDFARGFIDGLKAGRELEIETIRSFRGNSH